MKGESHKLPSANNAETEVAFIYCLSNPAMPGYVKIGYTKRTTSDRVFELSFGSHGKSATEVPLPFEIIKDWKVPASNALAVEQTIHRKLHSKRVAANGGKRAKEFFVFDPDEAVDQVEKILKEYDWWAELHVHESTNPVQPTNRERANGGERKDQEEASQIDRQIPSVFATQEALKNQTTPSQPPPSADSIRRARQRQAVLDDEKRQANRARQRFDSEKWQAPVANQPREVKCLICKTALTLKLKDPKPTQKIRCPICKTVFTFGY